MTALGTLPSEFYGPTMVGFVPRMRPVIKVKRYDLMRVAMIESMDRNRVIEAIAKHLRHYQAGNTLRQMYAGVAPNARAATQYR